MKRPNHHLVMAILLGAAMLVLPRQSTAFLSVAPWRQLSSCGQQQLQGESRTALHARKKRRRRKDAAPSKPAASEKHQPSAPSSSSSASDELPDFDLEGDDVEKQQDTLVKSRKSSSINGGGSSDPLLSAVGGEISPNMMGSANKPVKSVKQLLNDRSLESKFQFDDNEENGSEALPDLVALQRQDIGKKLARQDARRNAARASSTDNTDGNDEGILSKLPGIRGDDGKISPLKILENSTWVCIGLLVVWEIYINSPFFDRAAPMAPIVYQFLI